MNQGQFVVAVVAAMWGWVGTATGAVGRTPGDAGVSVSGTAQYSVALTLPSGRRGLTPQLGLAYDSGRGRGLAGLGWSVTGASVLYRCEKTVAQDGNALGVRNAIDDGYCLDGNRLRLVGGTYGTAGSEYRSEIQTYSRIVAVGTAGNGPQSFKVDGRDGLRYYYGYTADSRIESVSQATVRAWALSRIEDRQGNFIAFVWGEDTVNGGFRLEAVTYTGQGSVNGMGGVDGLYTVDFRYLSRVDVHVEYVAGSRVQQVYHLDAINVGYEGGTVRRYDFEYDVAPSTGRERLTSVQECGVGGTDCFSPTTFTYQAGSVGLDTLQNSGIALAGAATTLDVNGDGRDDLVYSSTTTSGTGKWMVAFASASGGYGTPVNTNITNTNFSGAVHLDYNLDGKADLLVPYSGSTWWVLLGTTSGFAAPVNTGLATTATGTGANAAAIDVNADGRVDIVWADITGNWVGDAIRYRAGLVTGGFSTTVQDLVGPYAFNTKLQGVSWGSYKKRIDFTADGRADIVVRWVERENNSLMTPQPEPASVEDMSPAMPTAEEGAAAATYYYYYHMDGYCPGAGWCWYGPSSSSSANAPYTGDFNGDGKSDALYLDQSGYYKYIFSKGVGTTEPLTGPTASGYGAWLIADWDGDGFDDAIAPRSATATWYLMRSNGLSFDAPINTNVPYTTSVTSYQVMDVNGDAVDDIGYRNSAGSWSYHQHSLNTSLPDLLATAQDGYGTSATFTYLPITSPAVYTKGTGTVAPMVDVVAGRWLVSQRTRTDGTGGTSQTAVTYTYEGARKDTQGRGWLGLAKRASVDNTVGYNLKTIETFRQDFPYIGALATVELKQSSGTRIGYTSNTWSNLSYGTTNQIYRYPYVSSSSTDTHEIASPYSGTKIRSVTTAVASTGGIDSTSGLITDVTTTTTEVATGINAGSYKTERTNHTAVFNDTTNWCLGRPQTTQQTNSHSLTFGAGITRTSQTTWEGLECRPTQVQVEPGSSTMRVTVALGYDGFGNVNNQTVTGINMTPRVTATSWGTSGRFPESVTNALSETTQQGWNSSLGVPSSVTDANGLTTSWTYDGYGRRASETRADGTSTWWTYATCSGCDSRVKLQVVKEEKNSSAQVIRTDTDYFDRWDRLVWQKTQLLTANDNTWSVRREFDARGSLAKDYVPYLSSGADNGYRQLSYDAIGRPTSETLYKAGGVLDRTTNVAYAGLAVPRPIHSITP